VSDQIDWEQSTFLEVHTKRTKLFEVFKLIRRHLTLGWDPDLGGKLANVLKGIEQLLDRFLGVVDDF